MLQFNPFLRPTVEQCLQSPYFNKVRQFSTISRAPTKVSMDIENVAQLAIKDIREEFTKIVNDYNESKSHKSSDLSAVKRDEKT